MNFKWQGICLSAALLCSLVSLGHAQSASVKPEDEFKQKIRVSQDIQPLGEKPFGENISLYNGSLSFTQTDIDAPGNGPDLQLTRSYSPADLPLTQYYVGIETSVLTDWTLNVPRIETISAQDLSQNNQWFFLDNTQRCTNFYPATDISVQQTPHSLPVDYQPQDWWHGYQMIMADGASQDLLKRSSQNTLSPSMTGMTFPIVTKQNWMISCLAQTANGQPGEGFLAVAPDGSRYWFDWLAYKDAPWMTKGAGTVLKRRVVMLLLSHMQDRFGNSLTYTYDTLGNPTIISASDGRQLTLAYQTWTSGGSITGARLTSATLQPASGTPRTWTYNYGTSGSLPVLNKVQLPDGTSWGFNFPLMTSLSNELFDYTGGCQAISNRTGNSYTLLVQHPSGLLGTFTLTSLVRGHSYTTSTCDTSDANPAHWKTLTPDAYAVRAVTQKVFSGAGLPATGQTWTFAYSPANESAIEDCASGCTSTVWTDVTDPEGHATRHTFSNKFDASESLLQRTDVYAGAVGSTLLRSEINTYASPTAGPWPNSYGSTQQMYLNAAQTEQLSPSNQRVITQDGDTYTWQAEAFDAYANITKTKRFSSIFSQCLPTSTQCIEEQTSYLNDLPHWVLGLPTTVTNVATGEVESENVYSPPPSNPVLQSRARFGQPLMSYTFDAQGQLASFTDGNSHTTSLSNYKRGIPQAIGYPPTTDFPNGTSETLAVDDFGQISAITDQTGHTTSYGYDNVGRITGISYPGGDEVAWLPKTFSYDFVTSAERGVPANHWRRTTTTGNAKAVTYFNAMLQPVLSDSAIGSTVQASTLTTYDAKGQKVFSAYPSATVLTFSLSPTVDGSTTTYDALGRVTQVAQDSELSPTVPLTSSTAYLSGARQQFTDPKGNVTTTSYQVFDSPSYDAPILVQAPTGITQTIARDLYGNPLSITQSGLYGTENNNVIKTLTYDSYHRLCRTTEPESGNEVMGYDGANNLAWSVAGATLSNDGSCHPELAQSASVITRSYDAMNRLWKVLAPANTQSAEYHYDKLGNVTSVVSGITTWTGAYNYRGMLTGESLQLQVPGLNAWSIGYAHDAYGSVSLIHYPDGENVSYAPDALGRPTQAGSYATGIGYFPNGQVAQFVYEGGAAYVAEQNARQMLSNFSYGPGSTAQLSEDLDYDANGNITTVADLASGPRNKSFGYDALNRLTSANAAGLWGTQSYTYDALNNLRTLQTGSQTSTYNYDTTNKLASISSGATTLTSYLYDTRGNVTGKNATTLVFDQKNQLTQIVGGGSYAYDASGRRVSKTVGGTTTYYFYSQAGQLMYQWAPGSALSTSFVYLGSKLVGDNESVVLGAPATIGFDANPNNGSYTVNWGAVPGASSYLLQESANGGAWTTVYSGSGASSALSGRVGGGYVYRVEGCIGTTCGAFTSSATLGVTPTLPIVTVPTGTINGTYTVSWTAPASATSYDVQERLGSGSWTTIASSTAATSISRPGTTSGSYTYQVSAKNASGTRGWAASAAVTVDTTYGVLPTAPTALTVPATSSTGSAALSWSATSLTTRYVVEQSSNGGTSWTGIYNSSGTNTTVSSLADGSYVFHVQACNTYGCSAWTAGSATLVVTHPPTTAPTVNAPTSSASGSYTVSWSAVSTATSHTLQERINGGSWTTIQTSSATSKAISGKGNGSYGYQAQACNVGGCGPWSSVDTTTVLLPPAAPASITIPATSSGSVPVSWAASSTATSYTLQHANYGITGWSTVYTGSATSYTAHETTATWIYQVQACNASGCSVFLVSSGGALVTIPPATAPSLTVPASSTTGSYTVSWGAVTAATSYTLQEQVNGGAWATIQTSSAISEALSGKVTGVYGYKVQACNGGGCGPWSGVVTTNVVLPPTVPTGLTATIEVSNALGVQQMAQPAGIALPQSPPKTYLLDAFWTASTGATTYTFQYCKSGGTCSTQSGSAVSVWLSVTGTAYAVSVKACNASGCSAYSAAVTPNVVQD